jgi:HD-GYP domain-containing protein (c-di-GMP phosphodiesterase class II)/DNA-binding CsgD family transcriptional regulator
MIRLAELLSPLAAAADHGAGLPPETGARTALIGLQLAARSGLGGASLSDAYYAGLLRHLGCSVTAHEETRLMGDEQELRVSFSAVDGAKPLELLKAAAGGFARGKSRTKRVARVARFMLQAPTAVPPIFAARCEVSGQLARRLGLGDGVVRALDETYERFDGKGAPRHRKGASLSPLARVLAVAETAAMFLKLPGGEAHAHRVVTERAGGQFDPDVVRAFFADRDQILAPARGDAMLVALLDAEPRPHRIVENGREVALVLADFADLKSTFTLGHSRKVAELARRAASGLGLAATEIEAVELAGWLHDLGRVSVSNAIWDKAGPLDAGEWDQVRAHPWFTERVLHAAAPWRDLARLAAADHERMDGGGYPRGAPPHNAGMAARLLAAADVYQALREPRPHRPAHDPARAAQVIVEEADAGRLDRAAVNAILDVAGHPGVRAAPPAGLTEREVDVLKLLVRGLVDKEIAEALGISHRTVHHHNQSIFGKLGVSTRGAAALFAVENDLA